MEWQFSTELAPWTNGCTERLVGIFKKQLLATLRKHAVPLRQLETVCTEITFYVNDRPLGQIIEEDTERMITPNMLMSGSARPALTTPSLEALSGATVDQMWKVRKQMHQQYWAKWQRDYLEELSVDKKWNNGRNPAVKPGDAVILKAETLEKNQWRLARILTVHKNQDEVVTTVTVKLPNNAVYTRSIRNIALLEPAAVELDRTTLESPAPARPEQPFRRVPQGVSRRTDYQQAVANAQGTEDPRPLALSYGSEVTADAGVEYTGETNATTVKPATHAQEPREDCGHDLPEEPRSKRLRRNKGFYAALDQGRAKVKHLNQ